MYGNRRRVGRVCIGLLLACMGPATTASASVLNLNFGADAIAAGKENVDPYHGVTGDAGNGTWNGPLGDGDITYPTNTFKFGDGSTAVGVSVNVGITNISTNSSVLATQPEKNSALGVRFNSGIYAGPAVGAIYTSTSSSTQGITLQISGLQAGRYDIYYVGVNTNLNLPEVYPLPNPLDYTQTMHAGQSASAGNFDYSTYATSQIFYDGNSVNTTTWVLGGTYAKLTVDLTSGNYLNLAFTGGDAEKRGFLNSLQIVSVPEPVSTSVLGVGGLVLAMQRRRRG